MKEIEATFLDIEHNQVREKLKSLDAKLLEPEHLLQRRTFDFPGLPLDKKATWVRLRNEHNGTHLALKHRQSNTIQGMHEVDIIVSDFDKTSELLLGLGMVEKASHEQKREKWQLGACEVCLDTWPWVPPFVEIEGPEEKAVRDTAKKLGFNWSNAMFDSVDAIYMKHFDVTRTEISVARIYFGKIPGWLEQKRK